MSRLAATPRTGSRNIPRFIRMSMCDPANTGLRASTTPFSIEADHASAEEQALARFLSQKVHPVPKRQVPFAYNFQSPMLYVRECYNECYNSIMARFSDDDRAVTVTGTPGIGKSVMMAYFFLRYKVEHPNATIVMASFNLNSIFRECKVWQGGAAIAGNGKTIASLEQTLDEDADVIFLLDGPPPRDIINHRFVVFTSPNEMWVRMAEKMDDHEFLVLPIWGPDELVAAVDALDLGDKLQQLHVSDFPRQPGERHQQEVLYRYDVFGGVARACLQPNVRVVERILQAMRRASSMGPAVLASDCYELFHVLPSVQSSLGLTNVKVASPFAMQLLSGVYIELAKMDRALLMATISHARNAAALVGYQLTLEMHDTLISGTVITARSLATPPQQSLSVKMERATHVTLIKSAFQPHDVAGGGYFQLETSNVESIDGLYLVRDGDQPPSRGFKCLLFRSRVAATHPIYGSYPLNANVLRALLQRLGIRQEHWSTQVALVFAVASGDASDYKEQPILPTHCSWSDSPLACVNGIKTPILTGLHGTNITTVQHLRTLPPNAKLTTPAQLSSYDKAKQHLAEYEEEHAMEGSSALQALKRIPQFVWSMATDDPSRI